MAEKNGKAEKNWKMSFLVSSLIHLVLLGALFFVGYWVYEEKFASKDSQSSAGDKSSSLVPDFDPGEMAQKAQAAVEEAIEDTVTTGAEKIDQVKQKMEQTVNKMDLPDVKAAVSAAESFQKVDNSRAYEPRENVAGKFDPNTATIYDIEQVEQGDKILYRYTLVDSAGRSVKTDVPLEKMSTSDLNTYRLFKMARGSDKFKAVLKSALKVAETKVSESQKQ